MRATVILLGLLAALSASAIAVQSARAQATFETFDIGLSTERIAITSNFAGETLVVFGALDNADARIRREQRYDIIVTLVGPRRPAVVRRKERTLGIWINSGSETFNAAPSSYALAATRPLRDITSAGRREVLGIGIDELRLNVDNPPGIVAGAAAVLDEELPPPGLSQEELESSAATAVLAPSAAGRAREGEARSGADTETATERDEYAEALRRIRMRSGLYRESFAAVRFVSNTLFQASLQLPADLPVGTHTVRAYLFRQGAFIRESSETLTVVTTGFESYVSDMARNNALLYGICSVLLAFLTGWFGRIIFKRD